MTNNETNKYKSIIYKILSFLNRVAHWLDLIIYYFLCDYLYKNQFSGSSVGWLVYLPLIFQIFLCFKYEWKVFKSTQTCRDIINNGRVMGFGGKQGAGKSSLASYLSSFKCFDKVYTNTPLKIRGKYSYILEKDIYMLDSQVNDHSLMMMDEATLFWHNILSNGSNKGLSPELYAQEVLTQCIRHFTDGNIFYISTDLNRLPPVIRENVGIVNFALQQGNKTISFITGFIVCSLARLLGFELHNGMRYWDFQQFEKIPDKNYVFDLSTQTKDEDTSHYANLIRVYAWDNPNLFDYNDRFLAGVYKELPNHIDKQWESLDFNKALLKQIGYGQLIDFFKSKKTKSKANYCEDPHLPSTSSPNAKKDE